MGSIFVFLSLFWLFLFFSHNIKLWVSLTVRASMIVAIAGFPLPGPPRGDGRCYCCCCCWTPRAPEPKPKRPLSKSNVQHWDRNSKFHLFSHDGYVPSLDFDDILRCKIRISRRIFWCSGFAVAPMLKKGEISVLLPKKSIFLHQDEEKIDFSPPEWRKNQFFSTRILKWI